MLACRLVVYTSSITRRVQGWPALRPIGKAMSIYFWSLDGPQRFPFTKQSRMAVQEPVVERNSLLLGRHPVFITYRDSSPGVGWREGAWGQAPTTKPYGRLVCCGDQTPVGVSLVTRLPTLLSRYSCKSTSAPFFLCHTFAVHESHYRKRTTNGTEQQRTERTPMRLAAVHRFATPYTRAHITIPALIVIRACVVVFLATRPSRRSGNGEHSTERNSLRPAPQHRRQTIVITYAGTGRLQRHAAAAVSLVLLYFSLPLPSPAKMAYYRRRSGSPWHRLTAIPRNKDLFLPFRLPECG